MRTAERIYFYQKKKGSEIYKRGRSSSTQIECLFIQRSQTKTGRPPIGRNANDNGPERKGRRQRNWMTKKRTFAQAAGTLSKQFKEKEEEMKWPPNVVKRKSKSAWEANSRRHAAENRSKGRGSHFKPSRKDRYSCLKRARKEESG